MNPDEALATYLSLTEQMDRESGTGAKGLRDQFLVLAMDAAKSAGRAEMAGSLWQRLASVSPGHPVTRYRDFATAFQSAEALTVIRELKLEFPPEMAKERLEKLRGAVPKTSPLSRPFKPPETIAQAFDDRAFSSGGQGNKTQSKTLEPLPWRKKGIQESGGGPVTWWFCVLLALGVLILGLVWISYPFWL